MKKILILSLISLFFMINNNVKCDITDIVSEDFTIDNTFPDQNHYRIGVIPNNNKYLPFVNLANKLDTLSKYSELIIYCQNVIEIDSVLLAFKDKANIKKLYIYYFKGTKFPEIVYKFKNVYWLMLSGEKILQFPLLNDNVDKIEYLYLFCDELTEIDSTIKNFRKVKSIEIKNTKLTTLPEQFSSLDSLLNIDLINNKYLNFGKVFDVFSRLKNLKDLMLVDNIIPNIPDEIGNIKNLESLYMPNNHIQSISDSIYKLNNLKSLGLANNNLTEISCSISKLKSLERLSLSNNKLNKIPDCIFDMAPLLSIDLTKVYFDNEYVEYLCAKYEFQYKIIIESEYGISDYYFNQVRRQTRILLEELKRKKKSGKKVN